MYLDWFRRFKDSDFDVDDRLREGRPKPSKTLNWPHWSMSICAKHKKSLHQHHELHAKLFSCVCTRYEWFRNKELMSLMMWSQDMLSVVFSPMNNCSSGKNWKVFFITSLRMIKIVFVSVTQREQNRGNCPVMLLLHAAKVILYICWAQDSVSYYELLKPNVTINGERYRTPFMRLILVLREKWSQFEQGYGKVIQQHGNVAKHVKPCIKMLKWVLEKSYPNRHISAI